MDDTALSNYLVWDVAFHKVTQQAIIVGSLANKFFLALTSASVVSATEFVTRFVGSKVERKT